MAADFLPPGQPSTGLFLLPHYGVWVTPHVRAWSWGLSQPRSLSLGGRGLGSQGELFHLRVWNIPVTGSAQ